jgi:beta-phosphoglucomutase
MFILIPLGGTGERFKIAGFCKPKALIEVDNKPIIFHLLDNLIIQHDSKHKIEFIYIPYHKEYIEFQIETKIRERYPSLKFIFLPLSENTRGAADTIRIALQDLKEKQQSLCDCPILCLDSDNFYTTDIISLWQGENTVFTFRDRLPEPLYSYVVEETLNNNNNDPSYNVVKDNIVVKDIIEKEKISDNACCGAYGFQSWQQLLYFSNYIIDNEIKQKTEYYTSGVIKAMLEQFPTPRHSQHKFKMVTIPNKNYYSLGTPNQVNAYEYPFLFDLDGTLVNTDNIYTEVWNLIFKKYNFNFTIDAEFFHNFIKGKNDSLFLNYLLPSLNEEVKSEISKLKDELFIEMLQKSKDDNNDNKDNDDKEPNTILLPGVLEFFERHKNRKIAIVTSCNKRSAEYILSHTGLDEYVSLLIASEDCKQHKPDPEPYLNAISILELNTAKTFIFEDSYSGYTSAKNAKVFKIILVMNDSSCQDITKANEYKITNYCNFNINDEFLQSMPEHNNSKDRNNGTSSNSNDHNKQIVCNNIKKKLFSTLPIREVKYNPVQLKTGYICDIQSYQLEFNNRDTQSIVLKINNTENELSKTAEKMNLYNNEINFYTNISEHVGTIINIPLSYGVISVEETRVGIMLENLLKYNGLFNIDLNKETQTLLTVVAEIVKLHTTYFFKGVDEVPENMRQVTTMNELAFFKELLNERFATFIHKNRLVLTENERHLMCECYQHYAKNVLHASSYPLSFCHGDLKSANIFYRNASNKSTNCINTPYFLDWQYIQLNKGVSDIVFLLVESIKFDKMKVELVLNYYYCLISEKIKDYSYEAYMNDFKTNLCIFPFVVCVWFNSEDNDKLLDKIFPIRFMKNLLDYYSYFLF